MLQPDMVWTAAQMADVAQAIQRSADLARHPEVRICPHATGQGRGCTSTCPQRGSCKLIQAGDRDNPKFSGFSLRPCTM